MHLSSEPIEWLPNYGRTQRHRDRPTWSSRPPDFHYTRRFSKADEIIAFRIARRERLGERLSRQLQGEGHPALLGYPMRARNFEIVCAHRLGREGHPAIFGVAPVDLAISLRSAAADRNRSQTTGQTVPALPPAPCRSGHEPRLSVL